MNENISEIPMSKGKICWRWFSLLTFLYTMLLGASAISEIQERQKIYDLVIVETKDIEQKIQGKSWNQTSTDSDKKTLFERYELLKTCSYKIQQLVAAGALDDNMTLPNIRHNLYGVSQTKNHIKEAFGVIGNIFMPEFIYVSASRRMYAHLIILSSIMGCIIQYFRGDQHAPIKTIVTGVGAGVVCYLAIDAGQMDILLSNKIDTTHTTSSILLGFLAGIFSNHVYEIVEHTIKKLKA